MSLSDWEKEGRKEFKIFVLKCVIGLIALVFIIGGIGLGYKYVIGTAEANVDHEIFQNNTSYIEGMISDLARYKKEYDIAISKEDFEEARALINFIKTDFSNFDSKKIENDNLRKFLENVFDGKYDKY